MPDAPVLNREPHELTETCLSVHCHIHHVDEPDDGAFIVCIECGHVYRTARELRRLYRWHWNQIFRSEPGTFVGWIRSRFVRARRISFCQHCIHDF